MDGPFLADTFTLLEDARQIAAFLILEDPQARFAFAAQARIAYVLQQPMLFLHGEAAAAYIARATVQGPHRLLFSFLTAQFGAPDAWALDFVIYVDAAYWQQAEHDRDETGPSGFPILREALIFHELCHLRHLHTGEGEPRFGADGRPLLALTRHTYERFQDEITRYGPQTLGLNQLALDVVAGSKAERHRERRGKLRVV